MSLNDRYDSGVLSSDCRKPSIGNAGSVTNLVTDKEGFFWYNHKWDVQTLYKDRQKCKNEIDLHSTAQDNCALFAPCSSGTLETAYYIRDG